ncbi:MAG TPA: hypothetical protein VFF31_19925 [Blastocatellia bacterium]|jgi:hypothetical protein|nr:hypothetical protein [Blastocatellia bacterium]
MKLKLVICSVVAGLCVIHIASALAKPDFSGTWVMDVNRSFSNPAGLEQTLTVVHTGDQIKVDAKIKTQQGEQTINETYTLDGKETEFTPPGTQPNAKGKRKAMWLPDAKGAVIDDIVTSDSPNGPVTRKTMRKWTLSPDGKTLTVDYYFDDQRGSFEAKRVFVKKS